MEVEKTAAFDSLFLSKGIDEVDLNSAMLKHKIMDSEEFQTIIKEN